MPSPSKPSTPTRTPGAPASSYEAALWQQGRLQLRMVQARPWLAAAWLQGSRALMARCNRIYAQLCRQPRPLRRRLQRQWGASLAGVALALALANAPVQAANFTANDATTLIAAITSANDETNNPGPDTITLTGDVTLTAYDNFSYQSATGLPLIDSAITIEGGDYTIARDETAGTSMFRLLAVTTSGDLTLNGVTLRNGASQRYGGAIYNAGTVTVNDSTVTANSAEDGAGAIYSYHGTLAINNSTISDNIANSSGGAIYSYQSTLTISNSTISNNTAGSGGGAIYSSYSTVMISESTISDNRADQPGGGLHNYESTVTISNSTLSGNSTDDDGGGLFNEDSTLTISNSTISGNSTTDNDGGGLWIIGSTVTISNSILSSNSAQYHGGGLWTATSAATINNSTLSGNSTTDGNGGGLYVYNGAATINNSTLSGNSSAKYGGGLHNDSGTVTISSSTISSNSAAQAGGGLFNKDELTLNRTLISGNSAGTGAELTNKATVTADNYNLFGHSGSAGTEGFTPGASDIVPTQVLAAILDSTLQVNAPSTGARARQATGLAPSPAQLPATHALITGSPAIDAAGDGDLATDQRGVTRPQGCADDIGAYEVEIVGCNPKVTIILDTRPNLATNLAFSGNFGAFLLDDPTRDDGDAYSNRKTFQVPPGSYTVRRKPVNGWFVSAIACTPTSGATVNLAQGSATLALVDSDQVTCTFTVDRAVTLRARAFNDLVRRNTNLGKRNAGDPWLNGWNIKVATGPTAPVVTNVTEPTAVTGLFEAVFQYLRPGDYTVCAVLPDGTWTPTTPNATDPAYGNQPCKPVTLAPGQSATLLFGAYQATVVASETGAPADETITDKDTIVDQPYDPAEDESITDAEGLSRTFLPLINR